MTPLSKGTGLCTGANRRSTMSGFITKTAAGIAAAATLIGGLAIGASSAQATTTTSYDRTLGNAQFEAARTQNGLAKEMNYGSILHAWMWSFNTMKEHMAEIADAGYTSVQTSPISVIKGPMQGKQFTENWYYVYQPAGTSIGNSVVGSEDDLKAMTAEAHKYGIRIIVDAVINHFTSDWNAIEPSWQNASLFHTKSEGGCGNNGTGINYGNRWQVTHCHLLGLWDLNTENQEVGNRMQGFLKQAVADGVDGFRYDAAKHIELPDEFGTHSPYFDTILDNGAQYQYGEVLQGDAGLNVAAYPALFEKYSSNGGGNTASNYGGALRSALNSKNLNAGNLNSLQGQGVQNDQLVTWVESHDTYANGDRQSTGMTDWQIRMGWGVIGARAGGAPLFFNRPVGSGGANAQFSEQSQLGDAGDNEWKSPEVKWVNKFRNAMEGNAEYLRNCQAENCLMIERYKSDGSNANDGVVVVNMDGDKNLAGLDTTLDDGTYTDQVNGGTITVANKKIIAGSVKSGKVSVFVNIGTAPTPDPGPTPDPDPTPDSTTTVYYPSTKFGADSTYLHWRFADGGTWTTAPGVKMTAACSGYVSYAIENPDGRPIEFVFTNGSGQWDNKNGVSGQNYTATGASVLVTDNSGNYGTTAPCAV